MNIGVPLPWQISKRTSDSIALAGKNVCCERKKSNELIYIFFCFLSLHHISSPSSLLISLDVFVVFCVHCLIYYGKMSAVISEQCLYAIPITAYISTDLEIFRMLLIILHCRVSFSAQQACCWTLFTHFLNCLHLFYVHKNRRPLDYSIRALAIYTVYGLSLALSVCFFHFTSV